MSTKKKNRRKNEIYLLVFEEGGGHCKVQFRGGIQDYYLSPPLRGQAYRFHQLWQRVGHIPGISRFGEF